MNQPSHTPATPPGPDTAVLSPAADTTGAPPQPAAEGLLAVLEATVLASGYDQALGGKLTMDTPQHKPDDATPSPSAPPTGRDHHPDPSSDTTPAWTQTSGHHSRDDDLDQTVAQRLLAVGVDLHLVLGLTEHPHATRRLHHAIAELDNAIRIMLFNPRPGEAISAIAKLRPRGRRRTSPITEPRTMPAVHDAITSADIMRS